MEKYCEKCNQKFTIAMYRRDTAKFCSISCSARSRIGPKGRNWKGGKKRICTECNIAEISYYAIRCRKCNDSFSCGRNNPFWGRKHTKETLVKISQNNKMKGRSGELHHNWIKDRSLLQRYNDDSKNRRSYMYAAWRKEVLLRDNSTCKIANPDCNGRIEVHHILGWKDYPELRYKINNGITLCHAHHPKKRAEEKRLVSVFTELLSVSKDKF